jgi:hypothetical protein
MAGNDRRRMVGSFTVPQLYKAPGPGMGAATLRL